MRTLVERKDGVYEGTDLLVPPDALKRTPPDGVVFRMHGQLLRFWCLMDRADRYPDQNINIVRLRLDNETRRTTVFHARVTTFVAEIEFAGVHQPRRIPHEARARLVDGQNVLIERREAWRDAEMAAGITATYTTTLQPIAAEAALLLLSHWPPGPSDTEFHPFPALRPMGL